MEIIKENGHILFGSTRIQEDFFNLDLIQYRLRNTADDNYLCQQLVNNSNLGGENVALDTVFGADFLNEKIDSEWYFEPLLAFDMKSITQKNPAFITICESVLKINDLMNRRLLN